MNARRLTLALVFALLLSGLFTFVLSRKVAHSPSSAQRRYVATARSLEAGQLLKANDMELVDWPVNSPLQGAFVKPEDIAGRNVLYPLAAGEPILDRDLAAAGSGSGLSAKIPEGERAISLRSDEVVGVAGFLLPGTHVDVLETSRPNGSVATITTTVLQDVEVLAAGQKIEPDPEGKPSSVNVVTLLLKPEDAEKVVLASAEGSIHFVLRNGADRSRMEATSAAVPKSVRVRSYSRPASKAQPYVVETWMGDKKVLNSFD